MKSASNCLEKIRLAGRVWNWGTGARFVSNDGYVEKMVAISTTIKHFMLHIWRV
jgi:hypothetical protein